MSQTKIMSSSFEEISKEAQKGLKKLKTMFSEVTEWIEEVLAEGKKTLQDNEVTLLPKTPSATARKSRRRVQRRSSTAGAGARRKLRSTILSAVVVEEDESIINISTDSTVSNKGGRKRGLKTKTGESKQKKAIIHEQITNCVDESGRDEDVKQDEENKENESIKSNENNKNDSIEDKLKAALAMANQIVNAEPDLSIQEVLTKGKRKTPDSTVVKKHNEKISAGSSNESSVARRKSDQKRSDDGKLYMQPVVMVDSTVVEQRLSLQDAVKNRDRDSMEESDKEQEPASSRRSSRCSLTVKKAKLNVARLSTTRRSIKLTATKSQQETITMATIQAAKNPSGKQLTQPDDGKTNKPKQRKAQKPAQAITTDDDDDDTMIEDTPPAPQPPQQQCRTRSKMAAVSKTSASSAAETSNKATAAGDAGRTTRSKARVKEIEKVLFGAAAGDKFKKPVQPTTPGRTKNIGSKVLQLQELLCQDTGFGLRPATPKTERNRRSGGKRLIEVAASPARTVTPKRLCKDGKDSGGADANGTAMTKSKGLQMSGGSSHVRSVLANFKKASAAPTNVVASFGQRTTPKIPSHEELLEQKRKELTEKEKRHNVLIQRRQEEQQRKLEETRKMREEHLKRVQIRRMELEQAITSKKHASGQKAEAAGNRVNRADEAQKNEELRRLAEEEEALQEELAATSLETVTDVNNSVDQQDRPTRSSRIGLNKDDAMPGEADKMVPEKDNSNSEDNRKNIAEQLESERLEKERLKKEHDRLLKEKQLQESEARKAEQEEREREKLRLEQEQRQREHERLIKEQKLKQEQELQRLKAEREKLERDQKEFERQKELERINREKQDAARKLEEAQARERIRAEAERKVREEQIAKAQQLQDKYKESANNRLNQTTNGTASRVLSVSLSDVGKQYKGLTASSQKTSGAMRVSPAEASRPVATGPNRVPATAATAGSNNKNISSTTLNTSVKPAAKPSTVAANTSHVKQDGQKVFNRTFDKEGDCDSYDMTPAVKKKFAPSTEDNYNIADLNSEDSTDDEEKPRKKIPLWAQGNRLKAALINQCVENFDAHKLFGEMEVLDLNFLFKKKKPRFNKRTSSAVWDEFPSFTRP